MDCNSCIKATAAEAAKVCPGLSGKTLGRMFFMIYPNPGCAPMHSRFVDEYQKAPGDLERKPAKTAGKARAAVA